MKQVYAFLLLSALLVTAFSCKKKDALAGFDKAALFADPTQEELNVVETAWKERDLTPQNVTIEKTHAINGRLNLHIISFQLYGSVQYAGVLVPVTPTPLPVQLFVYGFSLDDPISFQNIKISSDTANLPFIYVIPALRGQSLRLLVDHTEYTSPMSQGTRNDAFDGAADDAIACLNAVGAAFAVADTSKVIIRGGSRGGTVALLVAERDKRVKLAAGVAFPTDLLSLTAFHQNDDTYRFQFLDALINKNSTIEETRFKMIASSPLYFCRYLPKTQMHFGQKDEITPASQGQMLLNAMKDAGLESNIQLFIYPDRAHSNIADNNPEMEQRIRLFFDEL